MITKAKSNMIIKSYEHPKTEYFFNEIKNVTI